MLSLSTKPTVLSRQSLVIPTQPTSTDVTTTATDEPSSISRIDDVGVYHGSGCDVHNRYAKRCRRRTLPAATKAFEPKHVGTVYGSSFGRMTSPTPTILRTQAVPRCGKK